MLEHRRRECPLGRRGGRDPRERPHLEAHDRERPLCPRCAAAQYRWRGAEVMRHLSGALSVLLLALQVTCSPAFADDADTCARAAGDERIAACTRVIAAGRGNLAWAFNNRGNAYQRKGDNDRAIADYDQAIRLDPKNAASYANRGGAYLGKGDNDRAMADYDQAIKLDPKEPAAWNNRCWLRTTIGQLEGALADCNESLRLKPGDSGALDSRGFTYLRLTQLEKAIEDFDVVLRIDAKNAHSLYARGIAKRLSNIAGGDMDIKMAMAIEPNIAEEFTPYGYAASSVAGLSKSSPDVARAVPADPGRRVALVIGNSAYSAFPTIPNPRNDADDVANALRALGFDVLLGQDLKRADMEDLLIRFARKTDKADTALVFYAGHGLQYNGTNYLVPVDARIDDDADQRKLINLAQVINDLQNAARVRILI